MRPIAAVCLLVLAGCVDGPNNVPSETTRDDGRPAQTDWDLPWQRGDGWRFSDEAGAIRDVYMLGTFGNGLVLMQSRLTTAGNAPGTWDFLAVRPGDLAFMQRWTSALPGGEPACEKVCDPAINDVDLHVPFGDTGAAYGFGLASRPLEVGDGWSSWQDGGWFFADEGVHTTVLAREGNLVQLESVFQKRNATTTWVVENGSMLWTLDEAAWLPSRAQIGSAFPESTPWFAPSAQSSMVTFEGAAPDAPLVDMKGAHRAINERYLQGVDDLFDAEGGWYVQAGQLGGDLTGPRAKSFDVHTWIEHRSHLNWTWQSTGPAITPCTACDGTRIGTVVIDRPMDLALHADATYFGRSLGRDDHSHRVGYMVSERMTCSAVATPVDDAPCGSMVVPGAPGFALWARLLFFDCAEDRAVGRFVLRDPAGAQRAEDLNCGPFGPEIMFRMPADAAEEWSLRFEPAVAVDTTGPTYSLHYGDVFAEAFVP